MLLSQLLDSLPNRAECSSARVGESAVAAGLVPGPSHDVLVLDGAGAQERDTILAPGQGTFNVLGKLVLVADVSVQNERRGVQ